MEKKERIIENCFHAWITKDIDIFSASFADNAVYVESWGPAYRTKVHITSWFKEWIKENRVLEWSIDEFYHTENVCICEWYFKCECGGHVDGFNGVSIITFNNEDKIVLLKEFQSKTPNYYPYE